MKIVIDQTKYCGKCGMKGFDNTFIAAISYDNPARASKKNPTASAESHKKFAVM
jgi:hypothetical protein